MHLPCVAKYFQSTAEPRCPHCNDYWPHDIPGKWPPERSWDGVAVCGISVLRLGPESTLGGRAEEDSEHEGYGWQPAEAQANTACLPCSAGL